MYIQNWNTQIRDFKLPGYLCTIKTIPLIIKLEGHVHNYLGTQISQLSDALVIKLCVRYKNSHSNSIFFPHVISRQYLLAVGRQECLVLLF